MPLVIVVVVVGFQSKLKSWVLMECFCYCSMLFVEASVVPVVVAVDLLRGPSITVVAAATPMTMATWDVGSSANA